MLSDDTIERFRAALQKHFADPTHQWGMVRDVVAATATAARAADMSAEQFVIWVKGVWDEITAGATPERGVDPVHEREVVISAAIKAYYVQ